VGQYLESTNLTTPPHFMTDAKNGSLIFKARLFEHGRIRSSGTKWIDRRKIMDPRFLFLPSISFSFPKRTNYAQLRVRSNILCHL
jgi:hypothetical protein